jgi:hypothetical protein
LNVWKMKPSRRARRLARRPADRPLTGTPSISISPAVGVSRPPMRFRSVVDGNRTRGRKQEMKGRKRGPKGG